jgi:hypothetical protein
MAAHQSREIEIHQNQLFVIYKRWQQSTDMVQASFHGMATIDFPLGSRGFNRSDRDFGDSRLRIGGP